MTNQIRSNTHLNVETLENRLALSGVFVNGAGDLVLASSDVGEHFDVRDFYSIYVVKHGTREDMINGTYNVAWIPKSDVKTGRLYFYGNGGDDWLDAGYTTGLRLIADGGAGDDLIGGTNKYDHLWGGAGDDMLFGNGGSDYIFGEDGNDQLFGGAENDWMDGGSGNDHISGWEGNDTLIGNSGNDILHGGEHDDMLFGHLGVDRLIGGSGNDVGWGGMNYWRLDLDPLTRRYTWVHEHFSGLGVDYIDPDIEERHWWFS